MRIDNLDIHGSALTSTSGVTRVENLNIQGSSLTSATSSPINTYYPFPVITGLTLSNNGSGSIDIAPGACTDLTTYAIMQNTGTITKVLNGPWVVGSGQAGLDTGSLTNNTWYHVWLIGRTDTGTIDGLFSTSATAPTMPANYTLKRRIGAIRNTVGSISGFVQVGDDFLWVKPALNVTLSPMAGSSPINVELMSPHGIKTLTTFNISSYTATAQLSLRLYSPDSTDNTNTTGITAAGASNGNAGSYGNGDAEVGVGAQMRIRTGLSGEIVITSASTAFVYIVTTGYTDTRGKD